MKTLFLAAWLMLGGLALAQEMDQPAMETDEAAVEAPAGNQAGPSDEAGPDQTGAPEAPAEKRLVRTDLISGWNDRLSLFDLAEGSFDWLKSGSAFARSNATLAAGWEDLAELEATEQYSLVAYGPQEDDEDQWLIVIRHSHNKQKFHYDFNFSPDGDKMVLKTILEDNAPPGNKKVKELLTDIFNRAAKLKN